jgi:hypothetical protein
MGTNTTREQAEKTVQNILGLAGQRWDRPHASRVLDAMGWQEGERVDLKRLWDAVDSLGKQA